MNRREMLGTLAGGISAALVGDAVRARAAEPPERCGLGVCIYCLGIRSRFEREQNRRTDFFDPLGFLEYCHTLGAGGIQAPLGIRDAEYTAGLRRRAEQYGMFIEGIAGLPHQPGALEQFDACIRTAQAAGARAVRVVMMPGRRYERFDSAGEFREFAERGRKALQRAEPVAAKHKLPLAVENHKDHRVPERLEVLERLSSEYVGACVDTGNSFALCEDPMEVVEAYAPWAFSVHLKDQGVREYDEGFLFGDVPLGQGFLDLPKMVEVLRKAKPEVRFSLEMITRDPLRVPCLTEKYWATMADVPARELARAMRMVRANVAPEPLPRVNHLALDRQVALEESNVRECLAYAREHLGL